MIDWFYTQLFLQKKGKEYEQFKKNLIQFGCT